MLRNREDVIWAAGLFEGEGCISSSPKNFLPKVLIYSTDYDVIERFHQIVGCGKIYGPYKSASMEGKPKWGWQSTQFETAQAVAAMLWPWLCSRRQQRIIECFGQHKQHRSEICSQET